VFLLCSIYFLDFYVSNIPLGVGEPDAKKLTLGVPRGYGLNDENPGSLPSPAKILKAYYIFFAHQAVRLQVHLHCITVVTYSSLFEPLFCLSFNVMPTCVNVFNPGFSQSLNTYLTLDTFETM
jgi:hypothetical protein